MNGSAAAQFIIPIFGTFFLAAWVALVFFADRQSRTRAPQGSVDVQR